jgi:hypothetical protein
MSDQAPKKRPGFGSLALMLVLVVLGGVGLLISAGQENLWFTAAFAGWLSAGLLGLLGWWSMRKALASGDHRTFLRYTLFAAFWRA